MDPERRAASRKRASELPFIQFGEETAGIVWNVSEEGLGFQTVAPLRESGVVRLWISPNPKQRIELLGTIVWTDESKKSGGLRFTDLCPETRELVHSWLIDPQDSGGQDCKSARAANEEKAGFCDAVVGPDTGALSLHEVPWDPPAATVGSGISTIPPLDAHSRRAPAQALASRLRFSPRSGGRGTRTVLTGFLVSVLVLAPIVLLSSPRREIGALLIRLGEKMKGANNMQTAPHLASPPPISGQNPSEVEFNAKKSSAETPDIPVPSAAVQNTSGDPAAPAAASPGRDFVSQEFRNPQSPKHGGSLARALWSEIGAGNIAAEVTLAELYLRGDGVRKNCEQARVLLRAASRSGNVQAMNDLQNLKKTKCR